MSAGIYLMTYRGAVGWGQGLLDLRDGRLTGADAGGALYDGTYTESAEAFHFKVNMTVPPGTVLVQGVPPQPTAYVVPFEANILKRAISSGEPVLVQLPPGPANVIFKLLRSLEL